VRAVRVQDLGHEGPLQARAEARAAPATQAGGLDLIDDPVAAAGEDIGGGVPGAALLGLGQTPILKAVEIGEDPILVFQDADQA